MPTDPNEDPMDKIRAELDEQLAMLREPGASERLRRLFEMTPEEIAAAANAARRKKAADSAK